MVNGHKTPEKYNPILKVELKNKCTSLIMVEIVDIIRESANIKQYVEKIK